MPLLPAILWAALLGLLSFAVLRRLCLRLADAVSLLFLFEDSRPGS